MLKEYEVLKVVKRPDGTLKSAKVIIIKYNTVTDREKPENIKGLRKQILDLLSKRFSKKEIAEKLGISYYYIQKIIEKPCKY